MEFPWIDPIKPVRKAKPFDGPEWLFELKHDGFRAIAYVSKHGCELVSKKGNTYRSFVPLAGAIAELLKGSDAILDGEIVSLDADGRSTFIDLMYRRRAIAPSYYAFDLLWLNGEDLRPWPLLERKRRLRQLLRRGRRFGMLYADHVEARGLDFFQAVCRENCEGIIAKRRDGIYSPARAAWYKILNPTYKQKEGRQELFEKRGTASIPDGQLADSM